MDGVRRFLAVQRNSRFEDPDHVVLQDHLVMVRRRRHRVSGVKFYLAAASTETGRDQEQCEDRQCESLNRIHGH